MSRARDIAAGSGIEAGEITPHIIPDVLYPAVAGKLLDGSTSHGATYGVAQADGFSYYYTDIKGSKPIKDPRIGAHFGSQRHKFKSIQLLEQETATHGSNVYSVDGREWLRAVNSTAIGATNDIDGNYIYFSNGLADDAAFFEIVGYFSDVNYVGRSNTIRAFRKRIDGGTVTAETGMTATAASPLGSRYVDNASVINLGLDLTLGIHTLRISNDNGNHCSSYAIELIAQDTSNVNNIQIPSQNVVSYGKKFTVSGTPHYNPFAFAGDGTTAVAIGDTTSHGKVADGWTGSTATYFDSTLDTATSLGLSAWETGGDFYRPINGGRVVKWVDSSGNIKTSVNMMPPTAVCPLNKRTGDGSDVSLPTETSWTTAYQPVFGGGRKFGNQLLTGVWTHNGSFPFETPGSTTNGTTSTNAVLGNGTAWVNSSSYGLLSSPVTTVIGRLYKVVLTNVSISGTIKVMYATAAGDDTYLSGTLVNGQDSTFTIKAENTSDLISIQAGSGSATITRLDIAVYEIEEPSLQAEVAKTFHWREFGNGAANEGSSTSGTKQDASMLKDVSDDIAYVMDDGLTSLSGYSVLASTEGNGLGMQNNSSNNGWYLTFIGTGITIKTPDGTVHNLAQNLPYGTHIVRMQYNSPNGVWLVDSIEVKSGSGGVNYTQEYIAFHQPKMPPIPEDAVVLADYMLMADFVEKTATGTDKISKGVRMSASSRDFFYDSAVGTLNFTTPTPTALTGYAVYGNATTHLQRIPAFSTGCGFGHSSLSNRQRDARFKLNGSAFSYNTANIYDVVGEWDDSADDGTLDLRGTSTADGCVYGVKNQTLGINTYEVNSIGAADNGVDDDYIYTTHAEVISPIHTSSHYQSFETPFLNELVGGDRNMEQTNLVVTPDGKTWDAVTRDVGYIGSDLVMDCGATDDVGGAWAFQIFDVYRGSGLGVHNFIQKDSFAIAYDKLICLKNGAYKIVYNGQGTADGYYAALQIWINGTQVHEANNDSDVNWRPVLAINFATILKRGDYVQLKGYNMEGTDDRRHTYYIKKIS